MVVAIFCVLLLIIPVALVVLGWVVTKRYPWPLQPLTAWVSGIAIPSAFGCYIWWVEGTEQDSDPFVFFVMALIVSALVSAICVVILERTTDRR